jgi:hypothetical protein
MDQDDLAGTVQKSVVAGFTFFQRLLDILTFTNIQPHRKNRGLSLQINNEGLTLFLCFSNAVSHLGQALA